MKTQVEKMSRFSLFSPLQDVYENKGSYTLLSKMLMKRKVVRGIWSFCHWGSGLSAHRVSERGRAEVPILESFLDLVPRSEAGV